MLVFVSEGLVNLFRLVLGLRKELARVRNENIALQCVMEERGLVQ